MSTEKLLEFIKEKDKLDLNHTLPILLDRAFDDSLFLEKFKDSKESLIATYTLSWKETLYGLLSFYHYYESKNWDFEDFSFFTDLSSEEVLTRGFWLVAVMNLLSFISKEGFPKSTESYLKSQKESQLKSEKFIDSCRSRFNMKATEIFIIIESYLKENKKVSLNKEIFKDLANYLANIVRRYK